MKIPTFAIVVAMDEARGIGKNGTLAWNLPADLKHFKKITTTSSHPGKQNAVIMGRRTWESLPASVRPLPSRLNVVLSSTLDNVPAGVARCIGLDHALSTLSQDPQMGNIFVIGGANVYSQAIMHPSCRCLYITQVMGNYNCDVFFPLVPSYFCLSAEGEYSQEGSIHYRFLEYQSRKVS